MDAVGQGRRQLYQGKEYDYVFDVDIQDGVPPLKLPYNVTGESHFRYYFINSPNTVKDNPFSAAQRFLEVNELPLTYLDEVVRFIETNTAGVNIGTGGNEFVDPYTGMISPLLDPALNLTRISFSRRCIPVSELGGLSTGFCTGVFLHGSIYWRIALFGGSPIGCRSKLFYYIHGPVHRSIALLWSPPSLGSCCTTKYPPSGSLLSFNPFIY